MITELEMIWRQFDETYAAIRDSLAHVPDHLLTKRPAEEMASASQLVRHICRANLIYAHEMEATERDLGYLPEEPTREELYVLLDRSENRVRQVFEALTEEEAGLTRHTDWQPLGPLVEGELTPVWFALQIVRHSAYHLGQLNYLMLMQGLSVAPH